MDKEQLRIAWIDVMKGFLFTLVVLGHFLTTLPTPEFLIEIYDFSHHSACLLTFFYLVYFLAHED